MACATVDDLEKRWRALTDDEKTVAGAFLDDAEAILAHFVSDFATKIKDDTYKALVIVIECAMVKRAVMNNFEQAGVSQHTVTAGSYNENITYSNPSGDMYLTKNEKKLLGITKQRIGAIRPYVEGCDD